jgi:dienelactone hydrolase
MKYILLVFIQFIFAQLLTAQKPVLGINDCGTWPQISDEAISSDGKYVLFQISRGNSEPTLFIQSTDNSFKKEIDGAKYATFTDDVSRAIYINKGDSLCILELRSSKDLFVPNTQSYKIAESKDQSRLAVLQTSKDLLLYNFASGEKMTYVGVTDYIFDDRCKQLLLERVTKDSTKMVNLELVDLEKGTHKFIWEGEKSSNYVFNEAGTCVAFITESKTRNESSKFAIWLYELRHEKARLLLDDRGLGMKDSFYVARNKLQFSPNGQKLFFSVKRNLENDVPALKDVDVHIWNYQDPVLPPEIEYWNAQEKYRCYNSVIDLTGVNKSIVRLEEKKRFFRGIQLINGGNSDYAMAVPYGNLSEISWNYSGRSDIYLVSAKDGSIRYIKKHLQIPDPHISSGGKYVLWYEEEARSYFTYNIENGTIKNISNNIAAPIWREIWDVAAPPAAYGPAVWLENDESVLIYDRYDIWMVDPEGIKPPENITLGQGRKDKIVFRYVYCKGGNFRDAPPVNLKDTIYLCAFNEINKFNGFYKLKIGSKKPPVKLSMSPDIFYFPEPIGGGIWANFILKAKRAEAYLIKRRNTVEYPNLQITSDFKVFTPLTKLNPQIKFNWQTSELVKWKTFKGKNAEGILYKPENFDRHHKYPVILYFYERQSDGLNMYLEPELSRGAMNIPFYTSQGYLVFCPDIYYTVGDPGESAYDYVVSAAKMLSTQSWVDGKHMGIQGHSWGGYQVNYLVTRTNLFAAAVSGAGNSDIISGYGAITYTYSDSHQFVEKAQTRMGATLWQNPSAYIKNSPIFRADKVSTPLLIMHNKNDVNVPWTQGIEFFTGLRRLRKRVWMLQYEGQAHTLTTDGSQFDFTIRMKQYFDHFLKGMPWPEWMGKEIDKGTE